MGYSVFIQLIDFIGGSEASSDVDGKRLFEKIKYEIKNGNNVVIDFQGIESCVTRFLNPSIGDLYGDFDSKILNEHVRFKNVKKSHLNKIASVISNAKAYFSDPEKYNKDLEDVTNHV